MEEFHGVQFGVTWGSLHAEGQALWKRLDCDRLRKDAACRDMHQHHGVFAGQTSAA